LKKLKKLSLFIAAALLLAPLGFYFAASGFNEIESPLVGGKTLAEMLPTALSGYAVKDEPIARTEEMKRAIGELLNYNDAVFRIYESAGRRVSVYTAWWAAGRMSPRLVASHTPDVCWPVTGWTRDTGVDEQMTAATVEFSRSGFVVGQLRVFVAQAKPEHVVFWHKVGVEFLSYNKGGAPPWWATLDELWRNGLNLKRAQLFVRISSDQPLESFWRDPALEPLRAALLDLGLGAAGRKD